MSFTPTSERNTHIYAMDAINAINAINAMNEQNAIQSVELRYKINYGSLVKQELTSVFESDGKRGKVVKR